LLLLRASEVKGDIDVPYELAHLQVAFLELSLTDERNLEEQLWHEAGNREYYNGPIYWYGDTDAEEPVEVAAAVIEDTEATGLVAIIGERTRIKDFAGSCLPFVVDVEDGEIVVSDRTCVFTTSEYEDLRAEAAEAFELPELENTTMKVEKVEGDQIAEDVMIDRLMREGEAIDFCVQYARDEGEEDTEGVMQVEMWVGKKGNMSNYQLHERSKMETPVVSRCIQQRLRKAVYPWPDSCEDEDADPENCLEEVELEEGEEPPPKPHYEITFDFRAPSE
jgi:hypothetical protein